ncbi:MAG: hypothetical protein ACJA2M_000941 [Polaribacter sp.]|jgi:hypothetical protein
MDNPKTIKRSSFISKISLMKKTTNAVAWKKDATTNFLSLLSVLFNS